MLWNALRGPLSETLVVKTLVTQQGCFIFLWTAKHKTLKVKIGLGVKWLLTVLTALCKPVSPQQQLSAYSPQHSPVLWADVALQLLHKTWPRFFLGTNASSESKSWNLVLGKVMPVLQKKTVLNQNQDWYFSPSPTDKPQRRCSFVFIEHFIVHGVTPHPDESPPGGLFSS